MKDISADPGSTDDAVSSSSLSSPSVSDGSLLAMSDLVLDRSEDTTGTELSIDPSASTETRRKSATTKRYPSFRDLFKPLRGRSLSRSPEDQLTAEDLKKFKKKKKKKDKSSNSGCAGWLEKKKKRKNSGTGEPVSSSSAESSNGLSDLPPLLKTPLEEDDEAANCLKCSRCSRIDGPSGSKGVTYTKRPAGVDEYDESWLCAECMHSLRRNSTFHEPDDDEEDDDDGLGVPFYHIAPLAHLALNVLIVSDVSYALVF